VTRLRRAPRVQVVIVKRTPLPGATIGPDDRVGIGISFGMTARGDVFITGMAPQGPAKASGQIRRGDQLLGVDGVDIRGAGAIFLSPLRAAYQTYPAVPFLVREMTHVFRFVTAGWDVRDIVNLIIGQQGSFVRLETACLPDDLASPQTAPRP
jgi:hypothetical protein